MYKVEIKVGVRILLYIYLVISTAFYVWTSIVIDTFHSTLSLKLHLTTLIVT